MMLQTKGNGRNIALAVFGAPCVLLGERFTHFYHGHIVVYNIIFCQVLKVYSHH